MIGKIATLLIASTLSHVTAFAVLDDRSLDPLKFSLGQKSLLESDSLFFHIHFVRDPKENLFEFKAYLAPSKELIDRVSLSAQRVDHLVEFIGGPWRYDSTPPPHKSGIIGRIPVSAIRDAITQIEGQLEGELDEGDFEVRIHVSEYDSDDLEPIGWPEQLRVGLDSLDSAAEEMKPARLHFKDSYDPWNPHVDAGMEAQFFIADSNEELAESVALYEKKFVNDKLGGLGKYRFQVNRLRSRYLDPEKQYRFTVQRGIVEPSSFFYLSNDQSSRGNYLESWRDDIDESIAVVNNLIRTDPESLLEFSFQAPEGDEGNTWTMVGDPSIVFGTSDFESYIKANFVSHSKWAVYGFVFTLEESRRGGFKPIARSFATPSEMQELMKIGKKDGLTSIVLRAGYLHPETNLNGSNAPEQEIEVQFSVSEESVSDVGERPK